MFYSTITPNIFLDLLAVAGWVGVALLGIAAVIGMFLVVILKMGLLALGRSEHPPVATMSLQELEDLFADEPTSQSGSRSLHPAGKGLPRQ